ESVLRQGAVLQAESKGAHKVQNWKIKKARPFQPSRSCQKKIGRPTSNRTSRPASIRSGNKSTISVSEPTISIQRFNRKIGGIANDCSLPTGSKMTAGALVDFRSLTPIIRGREVSSILR